MTEGPAGGTEIGCRRKRVSVLWASSDLGWWLRQSPGGAWPLHPGGLASGAPHLGCPGQVLRERAQGLLLHRWEQSFTTWGCIPRHEKHG